MKYVSPAATSNGCTRQRLAQLGRGAHERRHLEAELGLERLADRPLDGGVRRPVASKTTLPLLMWVQTSS